MMRRLAPTHEGRRELERLHVDPAMRSRVNDARHACGIPGIEVIGEGVRARAARHLSPIEAARRRHGHEIEARASILPVKVAMGNEAARPGNVAHLRAFQSRRLASAAASSLCERRTARVRARFALNVSHVEGVTKTKTHA